MAGEEYLPRDCQRLITKLREVAKENVRRWPEHLTKMPRATWPVEFPAGAEAIWRSREVIVQVWPGIPEQNVIARLSIAGTSLTELLDYDAQFTWEQLQELKTKVGFGEYDAVEVYPAERDVVNIANFRHLWILNYPIGFAWRLSR